MLLYGMHMSMFACRENWQIDDVGEDTTEKSMRANCCEWLPWVKLAMVGALRGMSDQPGGMQQDHNGDFFCWKFLGA